MKYPLSSIVVHKREGLSTIVSYKELNGREFYLLMFNNGSNETTYVPVDSADAIIRLPLKSGEAEKMLKSLQGCQREVNSNTKQRRDSFKKRLLSGDINDIAYLYYQLLLAKNDPEGHKLGQSDLEMLEAARKMLLDELSITFSKKRDDIERFILRKFYSNFFD